MAKGGYLPEWQRAVIARREDDADQAPVAVEDQQPVQLLLEPFSHALQMRAGGPVGLVVPAIRCQRVSRGEAPLVGADQRVCGKPRSTLEVAGSGQRDVTTFERV